MKIQILSAVAAASLLATSAWGEEWGDWAPLPGAGAVSVRYAPSSSGTYTWSFRNDEAQPISALRFDYSFVDADTGKMRTESDSLRGQLAPGAVFGGFTAFVANSRKPPAIKVTRLSYAAAPAVRPVAMASQAAK